MPVHRIPRARLHEDITALEREGERVVSVVASDAEFVVFTCWLGERDRYETRAAS